MPAPSWTTIVFDLDGTIIDSVPEVRAALNRLLGTFGLRPITEDETLACVGRGARKTIENAIALTGADARSIDIADAEESYLTHYTEARGANTIIYPGVVEVLEGLRAADVSMGICSNKPASTTATTLTDLGLARYFDAVVCPEDTPHCKPDGRHILSTLERMERSPQHACMVGDSETDADAALSARIPFIAVSYGYRHRPLDTFGAAAVIDSFDKLPEALAEISP